MKNILIFIVSLISFVGSAQNSDTLYLPPDELSDTILGGLTPSNFPTGMLHDRLLQEDTVIGYVADYELNPNMAKTSDLIYGTLMELDRMSVTPNLFDVQEIYEEISAEVGKYQFDSERTVIPLGVIDYDYHDLDFDQGISSQQLQFNGVVLTDMGTASASLYSQKNIQMIAPMYDRVDLDDLWLIFKSDWTFADSQNKQVASVKIQQGNNQWTNIPFDVPFEVQLDFTATIQTYTIKVKYTNQQEFIHTINIQTPYLPLRGSRGGFHLTCDTKWKDDIFEDAEGNKLAWCLVQSCKTQKLDPDNDLFHSPLMVVTGYRPPILDQKFSETWSLYNDNHDDLLNTMRRHQFDVFLIRFNIHAKPKKHGMQESAELFIDFLDWVNATKADPYAENVIQASSMGSDIVRLSLMKMEHEHMTGTRPHHHTRMFNSYDPNFYGGNIPLAYQYMIKSSAVYLPLAGSPALSLFLNAFVRQKTVKELLTYHVFSGGLTPAHFGSPILEKNVTPSYNELRQDYLDALDLYDSYTHHVPLPTSTRNISISLGKIRGTNDELFLPRFNASDDPWRNLWLSPVNRYYLSPAKYSATGYEKLYRNRGIRRAFLVVPIGITHSIDVNAMQEVDNASGSYIAGTGNIIELGDIAYFSLFDNDIQNFSHKSVFTCFAINKNLWPSDGSHTLDMHSLGLMYDSQSNLGMGIQSDHYGYPNLGRPSDHFTVTPFEAIYVDHRPNNHINLEDDDPTDRAILTNFLLKEYRPWVLGLQNDDLGSQARSDYTYRSRRMAKLAIHTGFNVTPTTDKDYYVVKPNADLILEAGKYIELRPGTYTELGARALIHIYYEECVDLDPKSMNTNDVESENSNESDPNEIEKGSIEDQVKLYPNPSLDGKFKLKVSREHPIESLRVYDFQGNLIWKENNVNMTSFYFEKRLEKGMYLVKVGVNGVFVTKRLVVL